MSTYYMKLLLCLFFFSVCVGYLSQYFSKYYNIYLSLLGLPYKYRKKYIYLWVPSIVLHTCNTRSSVSTGWIIFHLWSTGTLILWNLRLVCLEYCSWFSTLISSSEIVLNGHRLRIQRKRIRSLGSTNMTGGSCKYLCIFYFFKLHSITEINV
jgi:hypothetical protein